MFKWLKLSQHHHTGRLRPHEHTSYFSLIILLLFVGIPLTVYTSYAASPGPEASSVSLTGTMPGKAPTVAATVQVPVDQQRFSTSPITVSGTCPPDTLVEIFKSDIFAGSTPCKDNGTYSIEVDLLIGKNIIISRVYDALNQAGPDSASITIYYDALPAQAGAINSLDFGGAQLLLNTDAVFRGAFPGKALSIPIDILGGSPPYAINFQWGDASNKVVSRDNNVSFSTIHTYNKPGTYQVSLQASDSNGRMAFLTFATIVNGQPSTSTTSSLSNSDTNKLLVLWPVYAAAIAVVVSFWIGEKREKRILQVRGLLLPS